MPSKVFVARVKGGSPIRSPYPNAKTWPFNVTTSRLGWQTKTKMDSNGFGFGFKRLNWIQMVMIMTCMNLEGLSNGPSKQLHHAASNIGHARSGHVAMETPCEFALDESWSGPISGGSYWRMAKPPKFLAGLVVPFVKLMKHWISLDVNPVCEEPRLCVNCYKQHWNSCSQISNNMINPIQSMFLLPCKPAGGFWNASQLSCSLDSCYGTIPPFHQHTARALAADLIPPWLQAVHGRTFKGPEPQL